ncbi:MAG: DUF3313 domain-containing protein [Gammaproteobacteria bacterium]
MKSTVFSLLIAALLTAGCATTAQPDPTGFLTSYGSLKQIDDDHLFFSAGRTADYSRFIVDPVVLLFIPEQNGMFNAQELEEMRDYFEQRIRESLTEEDGYEIVTEPGPGVARLRVGLVDVDRTIGALNIWLVTKATGAGIGGASAEGELVDSVTGEQLAASVRWGGGSRVLIAGFTSMGDAKLAIKRWTRDMREMIDAAHAKR